MVNITFDYKAYMMPDEEAYVDVVNHLRSQFFGLNELWATTKYAREYGITGDYSLIRIG